MSVFKQEKFTNIDIEDFIGSWGGEEIVIKSGETITEAPYLVRHFALHLCDKILLRRADEYLANGGDPKKEPSFRNEVDQIELMVKMRGVSKEVIKEEMELLKKGLTPELKAKNDAKYKAQETVGRSEVEGMIANAMSGETSSMEFPDLNKSAK